MNQSSVNDSATPRQDSHVPDGASPHQEQPAEQAPQPDITLDEVVAAVSDLIEAKKLQFSAQWEMVGAEAKLLRQSVLVTALATLATFAFGCVCWLWLCLHWHWLLSYGATRHAGGASRGRYDVSCGGSV